jgi:hypothetical protein
MTEWKRRPKVPDGHPFKEQFDDMLDSDRDRLLGLIEHYIKMRREAIQKEKEEGSSLYISMDKNRVDDPIEVYYWKYINKETRVQEGEIEQKKDQ